MHLAVGECLLYSADVSLKNRQHGHPEGTLFLSDRRLVWRSALDLAGQPPEESSVVC